MPTLDWTHLVAVVVGGLSMYGVMRGVSMYGVMRGQLYTPTDVVRAMLAGGVMIAQPDKAAETMGNLCKRLGMDYDTMRRAIVANAKEQ